MDDTQELPVPEDGLASNQFVGPSPSPTAVGVPDGPEESLKTKLLGAGSTVAKGVQAYQAFQGTVDANNQITRAQNSVVEADAVNMAGAVQSGALEKLKSNRFGQKVQGRMAVVFGEAGGGGASAEAVKRQAAFNTAENNAITDVNTAMKLRSIRVTTREQIDALDAQRGDPYMAAFSALL